MAKPQGAGLSTPYSSDAGWQYESVQSEDDLESALADHISQYHKDAGFDRINERRPESLAYGRAGTVWSTPILLLSLDGGGIRGLSSLLILQELMEHIKTVEKQVWPPASSSGDSPQLDEKWVRNEMQALKEEFPRTKDNSQGDDANFLPCHYFDYIAGTSTGALIATMLGRMRMSTRRTLEEFTTLTKKVYGLRYRSKMRIVKSVFIPQRPSEEERVKAKVEEVFGDRARLQSDTGRCKTIICSFEKDSSKGVKSPFIFKSYGEELGTERSSPLKLTDVMRATACSPYYFSPVRLGGRKFYDAGMRWTNPTKEACWEIQVRDKPLESLILSVGCGYDPKAMDKRKRFRIWHFDSNKNRMLKTSVQVNQSLSTVSENIHTDMEELKLKLDFEYHRLNATFDLSALDTSHVSSWKDEVNILQHAIEKATHEYLQKPDIRDELRHVAETLVDIRRRRSRTIGWEAFAFGVRYKCNLDEPCDIKERYVNRTEFASHLRRCHRAGEDISGHDSDIKTLVDRGRTKSDEFDDTSVRTGKAS